MFRAEQLILPTVFGAVNDSLASNMVDAWRYLKNKIWLIIPVARISSSFSGKLHRGRYQWFRVNIASGKDFVSSWNKALSEPLLTHIFVFIWRHQGVMG